MDEADDRRFSLSERRRDREESDEGGCVEPATVSAVLHPSCPVLSVQQSSICQSGQLRSHHVLHPVATKNGGYRSDLSDRLQPASDIPPMVLFGSNHSRMSGEEFLPIFGSISVLVQLLLRRHHPCSSPSVLFLFRRCLHRVPGERHRCWCASDGSERLHVHRLNRLQSVGVVVLPQ